MTDENIVKSSQTFAIQQWVQESERRKTMGDTIIIEERDDSFGTDQEVKIKNKKLDKNLQRMVTLPTCHQ